MKNKFRNTDSTIRAGDLLLTEQPFVFVLSSKEKGSRCDNCLEKGKVLKCSGCQFVHYCGRSCQKDAWNDHKWECANLKRISPKVIPDAARMLAKLVNKLNRGDGNSYRAFYTGTSFRMWKDLMSHYTELKADKKRMDHFTTLSMVLYEFLKDTSLPNTVELMGIYGRMITNSFTLLDLDMNSIGVAIYLAASILDHSCNPNAVATFDGKTINIRATKDMPCLDWNLIRISYIDLMRTPYERQTELLENYYFLCQCDRCLDEAQLKTVHAAKCMNSQCDSPVNIPWKDNNELVRKESDSQIQNGDHSNEVHTENGVKNLIRCNDCGTKQTYKNVESFVQAMEFTELHLQNMKQASVSYVDVCKYCLDKQEGVLHELNVMHAQTLDHAFDALIQMQLWEQACVYAEKLIPCFSPQAHIQRFQRYTILQNVTLAGNVISRKPEDAQILFLAHILASLFYYGDRHPLLGLLHLKYGKILLYKMETEKALNQLKSSEKVLKITHGDQHPLYKEALMPLMRQAVLEST